ncbi:MAG: hypothetical protein HYX44_00370 [Aquabacterium sp.]|nr:hypothetical protein [Aquabacterium sp.]
MRFSPLSLRSVSIAAALVAATASAHAGLTIPTNALVANSVQTFSDLAMDAFGLQNVTVIPLGNATAVPNTTNAYNLPITTITIGSGLSIAKGDARGSALQFARTSRGVNYALTLANFTIDYTRKQVLADVTVKATANTTASTVKQQAIYNYNVNAKLGIKYKFPLTITAHEVLDKLFLTEETKDSFMLGLKLPASNRGVLDDTDFGSLTQDILVAFRSKPVSMTPYVPAP